MLSLGAHLCHEAGYERGAVACLNMFIRACSNAQDMRMMTYAYHLISGIYILSGKHQYAIIALMKCKDLAEDLLDYKAIVQINFDLS